MLSSCLTPTSTIQPPLKQSSAETMTILFSDSSSMQDENSYYDALLELQQQSNHVPPFIIIEKTEREKVKYYNISHYPTMLVVTDNDIALRMEGPHTKEEILSHLKDVFIK